MDERTRIFSEMMAREAAERHRIPKATVVHPQGVIVPGDAFMTEKISDPDYVPYCMPCTPMQRTRRVIDGFECPACGNKANWDLTKFNYNATVQFDPALADPTWLADWEDKKAAAKLQQGSDEAEALFESSGDGRVGPEPNEILVTSYAEFVQAEEDTRQVRMDWNEDKGKKNGAMRPCGHCHKSFFGKRKRKLCRLCHAAKPTEQHVLGGNPYEQRWSRRARRQGY